MNFFQKFGIKYIYLNKFFLIIYDKYQNLEILCYLILADIKADLKLY